MFLSIVCLLAASLCGLWSGLTENVDVGLLAGAFMVASLYLGKHYDR